MALTQNPLVLQGETGGGRRQREINDIGCEEHREGLMVRSSSGTAGKGPVGSAEERCQ